MESLDLVLNDLSFTPLPTRTGAYSRMDELVNLIGIFGSLQVTGALRCSESLFQTLLCPDYTVSHWSVDPHVPRDLQTLFKTKATKYPFLQDEPLAKLRSLGCEFKLDGQICNALGAAFLLDVPAISLLSHERWNTEKISIQLEELRESEELMVEEIGIIHAASVDHIKLHRDWVKQRLSTPIKSGVDLWTNKQILFPHLEFCVDVEKQLESLSLPGHLRQVEVRLTALNEYDDEWTSERMFAVLPEFSGESDSTLNKYRASRTFSRVNGEEIVCEWHLKIKGDINWRIHFYVNFEHRKIIVGYIGKHLPI